MGAKVLSELQFEACATHGKFMKSLDNPTTIMKLQLIRIKTELVYIST